MDISEYLRLLRRQWIVIVSFALLGVIAGIGASIVATKEYTASTRLFVSVQASDSNSTVDAFQGGNAAQQRVRSYVDVVSSSRVLGPVVDELQLDTSAKALAAQVSAAAPASSTILSIAVTDEDPAEASRIANAIGDSVRKVVADDLEAPLAGGQSLVKLETIEPAVAPVTPTSPKRAMNAAMGLFAGLVVGVGVAALRSSLDTRIRGTQDIESMSTKPVLGGISFDPNAQRRPLIVHADPRSPRAEAFRALRTNLRFVGLESGRRAFVTTSAMPSEGKTTTTANLAIALAESGASVVLVDADLRRPRTAQLMGIEGAIGLTDVLIGAVEVDDAMQPWGHGGLSVLPAGSIPPNPSELLGSAAMEAVVEELSQRFDYVLIDAPPVLPVTDAAILSQLTAGALLVTAADKSTRPQFRAAQESLERVGAKVLGTVVTMLPSKGANAYGYGYYASYYASDESAPSASIAGTRRGHLRKQKRTA